MRAGGTPQKARRTHTIKKSRSNAAKRESSDKKATENFRDRTRSAYPESRPRSLESSRPAKSFSQKTSKDVYQANPFDYMKAQKQNTRFEPYENENLDPSSDDELGSHYSNEANHDYGHDRPQGDTNSVRNTRFKDNISLIGVNDDENPTILPSESVINEHSEDGRSAALTRSPATDREEASLEAVSNVKIDQSMNVPAYKSPVEDIGEAQSRNGPKLLMPPPASGLDADQEPLSAIDIERRIKEADAGMETLLVYRGLLFAALAALAADTSCVFETELGRRVVHVL